MRAERRPARASSDPTRARSRVPDLAEERPRAAPGSAPGEVPFESILFAGPGTGEPAGTPEAPEFFRDLNLDQVVEAVTARYAEYRLAPIFHQPLRDADAVLYRQEVMQDIERPELRAAIDAFARGMHDVRALLALRARLEYRYEQERRFLGAVQAYCAAVRGLADQLRRQGPGSRGLRAFGTFLDAYAGSAEFRRLAEEAEAVAGALASITYALLIRDNTVTVRPFAGETDFVASVETTFEKFRRGAVKDYRSRIVEAGRLNHVEAEILERVARLNPDAFAALDAFCERHAEFLDPTVARFDREVKFYVAYLTHIEPLRAAGLAFGYPVVSAASKEVMARGAFDLALAAKLVAERQAVVPNGFELRDPERIVVVTGPNHGGKTTFARMFGQLHYLAALGCPVPAAEARLFLFDRIFTHFERAEQIQTLRGKLADDLVRMRAILDRASPRSIVILNELFASTTIHDASYLSGQIFERLSRRELLAVCVTFLDELAAFDEKTVSMVAEVDPANPTTRTFRIERRRADGLAYAAAIAEKYRVTYDWLRHRIPR